MKEFAVNDADILVRVRRMAEPILESEGMELVDIEYRRERGGRVLRLIIDQEGGVTLDDCASISHELDRNLGVEDIFPGPYTLEVSSPGLNRPLKKESDFHRFINRMVKVKTASPVDERKTFRGRLLACRDGFVEIEAERSVVKIPLDRIVKANLEYEF
jgi:ribosome maturation factor RimP